jgi:hypothetical protein
MVGSFWLTELQLSAVLLPFSGVCRFPFHGGDKSVLLLFTGPGLVVSVWHGVFVCGGVEQLVVVFCFAVAMALFCLFFQLCFVFTVK